MSRTHALSIAATVAALVALCLPATGNAAFDSAEQGCRSTVGKAAGKLVAAELKSMTGCHKKRLKGKTSMAADCSNPDEAELPPDKIDKAAMKLATSIADPAKGKCIGLDATSLTYYSCPAPCDVTVPAVDDFDDLADCLSCIADDVSSALVASVQGTPVPPLSKEDGKCHAALGKAVAKYAKTILKDQSKCQAGDEKGSGVVDTSACEAAFPTAKATSTRAKLEASIAKACMPAVLANVDSCSDVSVAALQTCVLDDVEARSLELFGTFYSVGDASWTQVLDLFAANSCADIGCHATTFFSGGLEGLDDFNLGYTELLTDPVACGSSAFSDRVVPGDSASSFLVEKLQAAPDCGSSMPQGLPLLKAQDLGTVTSWIDAGAPQN